MIRELTMDEALEVIGGDPFSNSGSPLFNWDPLPKVQPKLEPKDPRTKPYVPVKPRECLPGWELQPYGGCAPG